MIDAKLLTQSRKWVLETKSNLEGVKNLAEEKKMHYRILFNLSLFLLQWYGQQVNAGLPSDDTSDANKYFTPENYNASCTRMKDYYNSIAAIASEDLKKSKNKQREADEQTIQTAMVMMQLIELFKKVAASSPR